MPTLDYPLLFTIAGGVFLGGLAMAAVCFAVYVALWLFSS
jgi:hypothetical protein